MILTKREVLGELKFWLFYMGVKRGLEGRMRVFENRFLRYLDQRR